MIIHRRVGKSGQKEVGERYYDWWRGGTDPTKMRRAMGKLAWVVRKGHYERFLELMNPRHTDKVLDVGVTADMSLVETNFFEQVYPHNKQLTIASVEDGREVCKRYGLAGYKHLIVDKKLPFKDKEFDIVTSWATIEHVGSNKKQREFIKEMCRVGKKVFITTPDRYSVYEPHTTWWFVHWLPKWLFRRIAKIFGKEFWAKEEHLNMLSYDNLIEITKDMTGVSIQRFRLGGLLNAHLFIVKQ